MSHFDWLFLGPVFVFTIFYAVEAVYWLHWLQSSISVSSRLSSHVSHRVDKQFLAFFQLCYCFCSFCCCYFCLCCCLRQSYWRQCFCFLEFFERLHSFFGFLVNGTYFCNLLVFFAVVARWYGSVGVCVCSIVTHRVLLSVLESEIWL